jgi:hypothetical protein
MLDLEAIKRRIEQQHVVDFDDAEALIEEVERPRAILARPKAGDLATCSQCGQPLVYSAGRWWHKGTLQPKHPALPRGGLEEEAIVPEDVLHKSTGAKPGPIPKQPRGCSVAGCGARAWKDHLYCPKHQLRWMRHGDPLIVRPRGRKTRQD